MTFTHLHCHTQYSLLDGAAKISNLLSKAKSLDMKSLAITDHGNMFGVPHFVNEAKKKNVKPIVGCEFYLAANRLDNKDSKRYHQILLAKNFNGYKNLMKLCSIGFTEGFYYKPRIDKEVIKQHKEGLIATSCCIGSEVCQTILNKSEEEAEKILLEWLEIFGEDFYIEVQPAYIDAQKKCNDILLKWSKKYNVPAVATNDVHYIDEEDSKAQDILICLQTGKEYDDPSRMKFVSNQYFLKSKDQMLKEFSDTPFVVENTQLISEKVESISLNREILMPIFKIPESFLSEYEYLEHLTYSGAKRIYGEPFSSEVSERLFLELKIIKQMGFEGYFLVVQDFISAAKKLNVAVGPGRGSVVGSLIAYCIGITSVCPLKYNLIFERFLNPERVSMPDIDVDFDDEGRSRVIDYVIEKYGKNQVAQIITFGSMGAKSAIRDVGRVIGMPLARANHLAKLIPEKPGISLKECFAEIPELLELKKKKESMDSQVLSMAETLEGSVRHSGIHAAGVIIAPNDITNFVPVKKDKDSNLLVTQYDGSIVESVGMLKMDFLGLKFLTIIKKTVEAIKDRHGIFIDINSIPLSDEKTFSLYKKGETIGTFQFESEGMRQWLIKLEPSNIEDLIAMNALYRPGPMQFIPNYINRKHGKEPIEYPHPILEEILNDTYGIMIYQEQIIKTAQIFAGYTPGAADILRKAMGKKIASEMEKQREIFIHGAKKNNNINEKKAIEVFEIMEKFAQYGFNRSHSTAYSIIAYQSAYLKANYTAEYMCSLLSQNQNDIDKVTSIISDCKHHNIKVLGPSINKSQVNFSVSGDNEIRFGLGAIKGVGSATAENIVVIRNKKKIFKDFFDFVESVLDINKKILEAFSLSGTLEDFKEFNRRQYLATDETGISFIEKVLKFLANLKRGKKNNQKSLFENLKNNSLTINKPSPINIEDYSDYEKLKFEKETIGFYLSGHPLDKYKIDISSFSNCDTSNILKNNSQNFKILGIISDVAKKISKNGNPYYRFKLEDKFGSLDLVFFGKDVELSLLNNMAVLISGKIAPGFRDSESKEIKISKIISLDDIREKFCKKVFLKINPDNLSKNIISCVKKNLSNNGIASLEVSFCDENNKEIKRGISQKKISSVNKFLSGLESFKEVEINMSANLNS